MYLLVLFVLYFLIIHFNFCNFSFFENPRLIHETRQKGIFDSNTKFCKELACGLRSVRKELMNLRPQTTNSLHLTEFVNF